MVGSDISQGHSNSKRAWNRLTIIAFVKLPLRSMAGQAGMRLM